MTYIFSVIGILFLMLLVWIISGSTKIWLADRALFWYRGMENHCAIILKNEVRSRLIFFSSDNEKIQQMLTFIGGEEGVEIAQAGKIIWIGFPWQGIKLHSWYMNPKDDEDPDVYPQFSLYMGERTWDYLPSDKEGEEKKRFISEWGVDTKDPIQVVPKLSVLVQATNAVKAVFGVEHHEEAIKKIILAAWRESVKNLKYFTSVEENGKEVFKTGDLQELAQETLNNAFYKNNAPSFSSPHEFDKNSLAWYIFDTYGFWVKKILIMDIDPVDRTIREALQNQLVAKTVAAAKVEEATGDAEATKIAAEAQNISITKIGHAEAEILRVKGEANASAIHAKLAAKGLGLHEIAEKLKLSPEDALALLGSETAAEIFQNSQYTYLSGSPNDITRSILTATDNLKKGKKNND